MDKYTKFILTLIAVGIIGINYHLFSGDIISKAEASHNKGYEIMDGYGAMHVVVDNMPSCN